MSKKQVVASNLARQVEIRAKQVEHNPFSPTIPIYIRPAMEKDAAGLAAVYNYYVTNSVVPEDQEAVTEADMVAMIQGARDEQLPFIVAIKGGEPPIADAQGRRGVKNYILPQFETVVGFALTEIFNFGFSGKRTGRSRATANLQLYGTSSPLKECSP